MPKKILQDIIVSKNKNKSRIRQGGSLLSHNEKLLNSNRNNGRKEYNDDFNTVIKNRRRRPYVEGSNSSSRFIMWVIAVATLGFFLFVLLSFFSTTVIKIVPLQRQVSVSGPFVANRNAESGILPFKLVIQEHFVSKEVPATGEEMVERKSTGQIIIYNSYSSEPVRLSKRTRFENKDGYEYRIIGPTIVPGLTVVDGEIIPGSIEDTVYADIPGQEYDIGLSDFTLPGFEGSPEFSKFYARSKTPIEGGFSGFVKIASQEDIDKAKVELENSLREVLLAQARVEVPDDFILYDDAVFLDFDDPVVADTEETKNDTVAVSLSGRLYGILFRKSDLSKSIAQNTISSYDGSDVSIDNLEELNFSFINRERFDPETGTEINFTLSGNSVVVWDVDSVSLSRELAGKSKESFLDIRQKYPGIQRFEAIIRPFWGKTFPENPDDITVKIVKEDINT